MEIICLETAAFYELVERVTTTIKQDHSEPPFKWVSQEKAMGMLDVTSKTTMQKLRDEGKIRFSQPAKKIILYDRDSIEQFLESHARETFAREKKTA